MASKSKPDKQRSVAQMLGWTGVAIVLVSLVNTGLMYRRWVSYEETERLILQLKGEVTVRRNAPELSWLDRWIGWHMTNALFRHPEELRITRGGLSSDQLAILHDLLREMSGIQKVDLGNDRLSEECAVACILWENIPILGLQKEKLEVLSGDAQTSQII